jgi:hypothetical protein
MKDDSRKTYQIVLSSAINAAGGYMKATYLIDLVLDCASDELWEIEI